MNSNDIVRGQIEENLSGQLFRVTLEGGKECLARPSGKMRHHKIRIAIGDRVEVVLDQYGGKDTNRIVRRL